MTVIRPDSEAELLTTVRECGALLRTYWPGDPTNEKGRNLKIETKADGSKVTEADFAINNILVPKLRQLFPGDGILSEEGPRDPDRLQKERVWILDPLDGTRSFIEGRDDFSILIALSIGGVVEWSCMYFPCKEMFAVGARGVGAMINSQRGAVSDSSIIRPKGLYYRNFTPPAGEYLFNEWMDSGMAFFNLCTGGFEGVIIKMTSHGEWDLAAPAIMVEESGGMMTDEHGNPIRFNREKIEYDYLVASNGKVHPELLRLIKSTQA